jgi:hypothetical protein
MQGELKVTVTEAAVYRVPELSTNVTLRLALPPADRGELDEVAGVTPITPLWNAVPVPFPIEYVSLVVPLLLVLLLVVPLEDPSVANELLPPPPQPVAAPSAANTRIHPKLRILFT